MDLDGDPVGPPAQLALQLATETLRQANEALDRTRQLIQQAPELLAQARETGPENGP